MKYVRTRKTNGRVLAISPTRPQHPRRNALAIHTARCRHCGTQTQHAVHYCGTYRVCAVCQTCGMHRKLGDRIPHLDLQLRQD
jgi:hypothetical protein